MSEWLRNNQPEGVLDFLNIWQESLPVPSEMEPGEIAKILVAVSSDTKKLSWRVDGPQAALIQKMVNFFWNVGAPEGEIDKLNELGQKIIPNFIGSWIDMSETGGMDGGWYFPVDTDTQVAIVAADLPEEGESTADILFRWASQHDIRTVTSVGRDMGATPPRQTDFKLRILGPNQVKASVIKDACQQFQFPDIPVELEEAINNLPSTTSEVTLSVVTSPNGFAKIGVIIPEPTAQTVASLLECVSGDINEHQKMINTFGKPLAIEYAYLNDGFGFEVYKEGADVHVYYNLGQISA